MKNLGKFIDIIIFGGTLSILWVFVSYKYEELPKPKITVIKVEKASNNDILIRYVEINNHEYILYKDFTGKGSPFSGMTHNPDCKYCKKDK